MKTKLKTCKNEGCNNTFQPFKTTDKYCSPACAYANKKESKPRKPINKKSKKQQASDSLYTILRRKFLKEPENNICFVDGCNRKANTVEHTKGRIGSNYLDVSTWRACCLEHNLEFERNTKLSNKYQLSKFHDGKKIQK